MSYNPGDAKSIFLEAMELANPSDRTAFIEQACAGQPELRARVQILLKSIHDPDSLLDQPASAIDRTHVASNAQSTSLDFLEPCDVPGSLGQVGGYAALELIGRGGMGIVIRAIDSKLNRVVAIKLLAPEFAGNPQARRRFLREAQAAAAVSHDHVVTIHAIDDDQRLPLIVMECVVGQSLQQKIDRVGALTLKEILRIGMQAATGLAAAHAQGLVHRDIKPANILLENGVERVKLTDFGLARMVDDASVTQSGVIAGTPQYMSPEQARGDAIDSRSDVFSLGCVLYAMCVGHAPFRASTTMGVLKRVCEESPRPIRECNAEIPEWLEGVIAKLMAKSPADRYQSASEVADLLRLSLAHLQQPGLVSLPSAAQLAGQPSRSTAAKSNPPPVPTDIASQLAGPARLLILAGILNWVALLLSLPLMAYWSTQADSPVDPGLALTVFPILAVGSAVILYGALRMWHAESYGWALASTLCAILIGPGYLIGWPAGFWSLAVLTRPNVRRVFEQRGPIRPVRATMAAAGLTALVAGLAWFGQSLVLAAGNLAEVRFELQDPDAEIVLVKDGKTYHREAGKNLYVSPGIYDVRIEPSAGLRLSRVAYLHRMPMGDPAQPAFSFTPHMLSIGRGEIVRFLAEFSPVELDLNGLWDSPHSSAVIFSHPPISEGAATVPIRGEFRDAGSGQGNKWIEATLNVASRTIEGELHSGASSGQVRLLVSRKGDRINGSFGWRNTSNGDEAVSAHPWELHRRSNPGNPGQPEAAASNNESSNLSHSNASNQIPHSTDRIDLNGDWESRWGKVVFSYQLGTAVSIPITARYYEGRGTMEGTLNQLTRTMEGEFLETGGAKGHIRLTIADDGNSIKGQYGYGIDPANPDDLPFEWNMTRVAPNIEPSRPAAANTPFDANQARKHQAAWAKFLGLSVEVKDSVGLSLTLIPPGKFRMGNTPEELEKLRQELESLNASPFEKFISQSSGPVHPVELTQPFYMGKYEVTVAQFETFLKESGYKTSAEQEENSRFSWKKFIPEGDRETQPVCGVSWVDAKAFCDWLSTKPATGEKKFQYNLPTEAQWEYACRAGSQSLWTFGNQVDDLPEYAIVGQKGTPFPAVIGLRRSNAFGLFDMHGNVDEWCFDWHNHTFYGRSPLHDPVYDATPSDPASGRVARGGAWNADPWWSRSTTRTYDSPASPMFAKGFRVMRQIESKPKVN